MEGCLSGYKSLVDDPGKQWTEIATYSICTDYISPSYLGHMHSHNTYTKQTDDRLCRMEAHEIVDANPKQIFFLNTQQQLSSNYFPFDLQR